MGLLWSRVVWVVWLFEELVVVGSFFYLSIYCVYMYGIRKGYILFVFLDISFVLMYPYGTIY